jgi:hypothetical protein
MSKAKVLATQFRASWLLGLLVAGNAWAVYQPSQLPDPSRRWSVSLSVREGYDDNVDASPTIRKGSATTSVESQLFLNIPMDQSFFGLRYAYGLTYYSDRADDDLDQNHSWDLFFSHRFTSRLTLDMSDTLRRTVTPSLLEDFGRGPVLVRQNGSYWLNYLTAGLTYNVSRRWLASLSQSWETRFYDQSNDNDLDTYTTTASIVYTIDPVNTLGCSFRFGYVDYEVTPQLGDRDSTSESLFLTYTHLFSPQISFNAAGGITLVQYATGNGSLAPYASSGFAYTYAPGSTVSLTLGYSLGSSDSAEYRSSQSLSVGTQISHRLTPKCRLTANLGYVHSSLEDAITGAPSLDEDAIRFNASVSYAFFRWLYADLTYSFEQYWPEDSTQSYNRNRITAGVRFVY